MKLTKTVFESVHRFPLQHLFGRPRSILRMPSSAVIAYIPYFPSVHAMPPECPYRNFRWRFRLRSALGFLFRSGNPEPPSILDCHADLTEFLENRQYRDALWADGIVLQNDESTSSLSLLCGHRVGFTPAVGKFHPGVGSFSPTAVLLGDGSLRITLITRFKVGKLTNWASRIMTGHMAPSAWTQIQYTIWENGLFDLQFTGSSIPSQKHYVMDREVFHHDMLELDASAMSGFIKAGDCTLAPERSFPMLLPWISSEESSNK